MTSATSYAAAGCGTLGGMRHRSRLLAGLSLLALACGGSTQSSGGTGGGAGAAGSGGSFGGAGGTGGLAGVGGGLTGGAPPAGGTAGVCDGPAVTSCSEPWDCRLATPSCCLCGTPELDDYIAINRNAPAECDCPQACDCVLEPNPNLGATCQAGRCTGFDVRRIAELSACQSDSECVLREGAGCCEGCGGGEWSWVALRKDSGGALSNLVCGSGPGACPPCMPPPPPDTKRAACVAGRCEVTEVAGTGGASGGCNYLTQLGAQVIAGVMQGAAPAAQGGVITEGFYKLVDVRLYGGAAGDKFWRTLRVDAGELKTVVRDGDSAWDETTAGKFDVSGAELVRTDSCPNSLAWRFGFTATNGSFILQESQGAGKVAEFVYEPTSL
jgi:hypothetical protein